MIATATVPALVLPQAPSQYTNHGDSCVVLSV
jgi:hypothetical protein